MNGDGGADRGVTAQRDYAETYLDEDEALLEARAHGADFGCDPVSVSVGAALRFLATSLRARSVVEIGTGAGVSGLWLLRGMAATGVLTSIDVEPEHQRAARAVFLAEGISPSRVRLINGMALNVLPRLADNAYDLVFVDAITMEYPRYLEEAVRLLRPGGVVALAGALSPNPAIEPLRTDPECLALREVLRICHDDELLVPLLLPIGDGLLLAAKAL